MSNAVFNGLPGSLGMDVIEPDWKYRARLLETITEVKIRNRLINSGGRALDEIGEAHGLRRR